MAEFTYDLTVSHQPKQDTESPRGMCQLLNNRIGETTCYRNKNLHNYEGVEPLKYFAHILKYHIQIHGYLNRTTTVHCSLLLVSTTFFFSFKNQ